MSLYNNFNEEKKGHELWEKVRIMLENKDVMNQCLNISKNSETLISGWLKYGGAYERLPGANKPDYLARSTASRQGTPLLLLRSLQDSRETLVVTLGNVRP